MELYITEPFEHLPATWLIAILGGPTLFLAGRAALEYQVFDRVSRSRTAGLLVLALLVPVTLPLPPLPAGAAAALVLLGVAAVDTRRSRHRPREASMPPF